MEALTDSELVLRIAAAGLASGAERASAEADLHRRFAARIELYGRRHLPSAAAAHDLVQEVLLRVLEAIRGGKVANPASLASFVLGTCRNVTWDARRVEQRQHRIVLAAAALEEEAAPAVLERSEVVRLLGCMGGLPEREAAVVRMSFWEDREADDIAGRLGVSAGNVRVLRHRALAKLVGCMHAEHVA